MVVPAVAKQATENILGAQKGTGPPRLRWNLGRFAEGFVPRKQDIPFEQRNVCAPHAVPLSRIRHGGRIERQNDRDRLVETRER